MFEKSNQKIGTAPKDPGKSLWPQCYAMQVAGRLRDNRDFKIRDATAVRRGRK